MQPRQNSQDKIEPETEMVVERNFLANRDRPDIFPDQTRSGGTRNN